MQVLRQRDKKKIKVNKQKRVICKCKRTAIIPSGSKWLKIKDISSVEIYASFMLSYSPSLCWALLEDRRWWQSFESKTSASLVRRHMRSRVDADLRCLRFGISTSEDFSLEVVSALAKERGRAGLCGAFGSSPCLALGCCCLQSGQCTSPVNLPKSFLFIVSLQSPSNWEVKFIFYFRKSRVKSRLNLDLVKSRVKGF